MNTDIKRVGGKRGKGKKGKKSNSLPTKPPVSFSISPLFHFSFYYPCSSVVPLFPLDFLLFSAAPIWQNPRRDGILPVSRLPVLPDFCSTSFLEISPC